MTELWGPPSLGESDTLVKECPKVSGCMFRRRPDKRCAERFAFGSLKNGNLSGSTRKQTKYSVLRRFLWQNSSAWPLIVDRNFLSRGHHNSTRGWNDALPVRSYPSSPGQRISYRFISLSICTFLRVAGFVRGCARVSKWEGECRKGLRYWLVGGLVPLDKSVIRVCLAVSRNFLSRYAFILRLKIIETRGSNRCLKHLL